MKTALVVSEGSPGHDSQSEGLARALGEVVGLGVRRVDGRSRAAGWARPAVRAAMGRGGRALPGWALSRVCGVRYADVADGVDVVISSGGKSVFAARSLAVRLGAPLVFVDEQKKFPDGWFDVIVSPVAGDARANVVRAAVLPSTVSAETVEAAARGTARPGGTLWAMVIGGASRSHRYSADDWRTIGAGMNALAAREGVRWLVTTSRRTGAAAEGALRGALDPAVVADAIWWAEAPRRELHAFLGMSDAVFVTQDSVTMVTECVSSGRPVVIVRPGDVRFPAGSFLPGYFEGLEGAGLATRVSAGGLGAVRPGGAGDVSGVTAALAREVAGRLGWGQSE